MSKSQTFINHCKTRHIKMARSDRTKTGNRYLYRTASITIDRAVFANVCENKRLPILIRSFCACTAKAQIHHNTIQYKGQTRYITKMKSILTTRKNLLTDSLPYSNVNKTSNESGIFIIIHSCQSLFLQLSIPQNTTFYSQTFKENRKIFWNTEI